MSAENQGVSISLKRERYTLIPRTLCFVFDGDDVLLLKGAPNKGIWADKYNGVGGHVERDEDLYNAALREIEEETGLKVSNLQLAGIVNINAGRTAGIGMFVFRTGTTTRLVQPSAEGELEWIPVSDFAGLELVEDLPVILPRVFKMKTGDPPFFARYHYDEEGQLVITFHDG